MPSRARWYIGRPGTSWPSGRLRPPPPALAAPGNIGCVAKAPCIGQRLADWRLARERGRRRKSARMLRTLPQDHVAIIADTGLTNSWSAGDSRSPTRFQCRQAIPCSVHARGLGRGTALLRPAATLEKTLDAASFHARDAVCQIDHEPRSEERR